MTPHADDARARRDSALIADAFDERDHAVMHMLHLAIQACRKARKYVGICGREPSDRPNLSNWLMEEAQPTS